MLLAGSNGPQHFGSVVSKHGEVDLRRLTSVEALLVGASDNELGFLLLGVWKFANGRNRLYASGKPRVGLIGDSHSRHCECGT